MFRRFWFRRLRRILPLALTVSFVSLIISLLIAPVSVQRNNFLDFLGSASFSLNFILQNRQVDYLANDALPSMFQQYWSLSIEEQFYLFLPLFLVFCVWLSRPLRTRPEKLITTALSIAWVSSLFFAGSAYLTGTNLYFSSLGRFWELLSGVLVYLIAQKLSKMNKHLPNQFQSKYLIIGLWVGLLVCLFVIKPTETYPGFQALFPVVFSGLIILLGSLIKFPRIKFCYFLELAGLLSFGIYLWHWPVLVSAIYLGFSGSLVNLFLLFLTVVLSVVSFYLIEEPIRKWSPKQSSTTIKILIFVALGVIVAFTASIVFSKEIQSTRISGSAGLCAGALALKNDACSNNQVVTDFDRLASGNKDLDPNWCLVEPTDDWKTCKYFNEYKFGIALVGDSHAAALVPALKIVAKQNQEFLQTYTRFGCPGITSSYFEASFHDSIYWKQCNEWSKRALNEIAANKSIQKVVFAGWYTSYPDSLVPKNNQLSAEKVTETIKYLRSHGKEVYFVTDVPDTKGTNIPDCILKEGKGAINPCVIEGSQNQLSNVVINAAKSTKVVNIIDMYSFICPEIYRCSSVIGGIPVYADTNHLSDSFAKSLGQFFTESIK